MQTLPCIDDSQCSFLYTCQQQLCEHNNILPLSAYTVSVYAFTGLAAALCNVSGNSMGIFKILILMLMLNYSMDQATGLSQALVVGTAIPNFISIIIKKHPNGLTSLVNYNLLMIIIPCSLIGSTFGALGQMFIPKLGQFILLILIFSFFIYTFVLKLKNSVIAKPIEPTIISIKESELAPSLLTNDQQAQKMKQYQISCHIWDILLSVMVFLVFQFLAFLLQGKLPFYSFQKCSIQFIYGLLILLTITVIYLLIVKKIINQKYSKYKKYSIFQQIYLDGRKQFIGVVIGAISAGVIQGVLGMGCGTCIMLVLLSYPINSTAASATSGYQILFTGSASLFQYFINGQVQIFQSVWMMGVCCIWGGILTIILYAVISKLNPIVVNKVMYIIILSLCVMSIILTFPTASTLITSQGWPAMTQISFKC